MSPVTMHLIAATNNLGKLMELRALLPTNIILLSAVDAGVQLPAETGTTYAENALIKARAAAASGMAAISDDSGLEVDALAGAPGVRSARFAGEHATDEENNRMLLQSLAAYPEASRSARFRSVVALVVPLGLELVAEGVVDGRIVREPRGTYGFGYDPLFEFHDGNATLENGLTAAEVAPARKNAVSHRARAIVALLELLNERGLTLQEAIAGQYHHGTD